MTAEPLIDVFIQPANHPYFVKEKSFWTVDRAAAHRSRSDPFYSGCTASAASLPSITGSQRVQPQCPIAVANSKAQVDQNVTTENCPWHAARGVAANETEECGSLPTGRRLSSSVASPWQKSLHTGCEGQRSTDGKKTEIKGSGPAFLTESIKRKKRRVEDRSGLLLPKDHHIWDSPTVSDGRGFLNAGYCSSKDEAAGFPASRGSTMGDWRRLEVERAMEAQERDGWADELDRSSLRGGALDAQSTSGSSCHEDDIQPVALILHVTDSAAEKDSCSGAASSGGLPSLTKRWFARQKQDSISHSGSLRYHRDSGRSLLELPSRSSSQRATCAPSMDPCGGAAASKPGSLSPNGRRSRSPRGHSRSRSRSRSPSNYSCSSAWLLPGSGAWPHRNPSYGSVDSVAHLAAPPASTAGAGSHSQESSFFDIVVVQPGDPAPAFRWQPPAEDREVAAERPSIVLRHLEQFDIDDEGEGHARARKTHRLQRRRKVTLVVLLLAVLLAAGIAASSILIPGTNPPSTMIARPSPDNHTMLSSTSTPDALNKRSRFVGTILLKIDYSPDMADLQSVAARNLSTQFCDTMKRIYSEQNFSAEMTYDDCEVTKLERGSVKVSFKVTFSAPRQGNESKELDAVREALESRVRTHKFGTFACDIKDFKVEKEAVGVNSSALPVTSIAKDVGVSLELPTRSEPESSEPALNHSQGASHVTDAINLETSAEARSSAPAFYDTRNGRDDVTRHATTRPQPEFWDGRDAESSISLGSFTPSLPDQNSRSYGQWSHMPVPGERTDAQWTSPRATAPANGTPTGDTTGSAALVSALSTAGSSFSLIPSILTGPTTPAYAESSSGAAITTPSAVPVYSESGLDITPSLSKYAAATLFTIQAGDSSTEQLPDAAITHPFSTGLEGSAPQLIPEVHLSTLGTKAEPLTTRRPANQPQYHRTSSSDSYEAELAVLSRALMGITMSAGTAQRAITTGATARPQPDVEYSATLRVSSFVAVTSALGEVVGTKMGQHNVTLLSTERQSMLGSTGAFTSNDSSLPNSEETGLPTNPASAWLSMTSHTTTRPRSSTRIRMQATVDTAETSLVAAVKPSTPSAWQQPSLFTTSSTAGHHALDSRSRSAATYAMTVTSPGPRSSINRTDSTLGYVAAATALSAASTERDQSHGVTEQLRPVADPSSAVSESPRINFTVQAQYSLASTTAYPGLAYFVATSVGAENSATPGSNIGAALPAGTRTQTPLSHEPFAGNTTAEVGASAGPGPLIPSLARAEPSTAGTPQLSSLTERVAASPSATVETLESTASRSPELDSMQGSIPSTSSTNSPSSCEPQTSLGRAFSRSTPSGSVSTYSWGSHAAALTLLSDRTVTAAPQSSGATAQTLTSSTRPTAAFTSVHGVLRVTLRYASGAAIESSSSTEQDGAVYVMPSASDFPLSPSPQTTAAQMSTTQLQSSRALPVPTSLQMCSPGEFSIKPNITDCRAYYVCVNGSVLPMVCNTSSYFNASVSTCDSCDPSKCSLCTVSRSERDGDGTSQLRSPQLPRSAGGRHAAGSTEVALGLRRWEEGGDTRAGVTRTSQPVSARVTTDMAAPDRMVPHLNGNIMHATPKTALADHRVSTAADIQADLTIAADRTHLSSAAFSTAAPAGGLGSRVSPEPAEHPLLAETSSRAARGAIIATSEAADIYAGHTPSIVARNEAVSLSSTTRGGPQTTALTASAETVGAVTTTDTLSAELAGTVGSRREGVTAGRVSTAETDSALTNDRSGNHPAAMPRPPAVTDNARAEFASRRDTTGGMWATIPLVIAAGQNISAAATAARNSSSVTRADSVTPALTTLMVGSERESLSTRHHLTGASAGYGQQPTSSSSHFPGRQTTVPDNGSSKPNPCAGKLPGRLYVNPENCTEMVFCMKDGNFVSSVCECNQMFNSTAEQCVACDASECLQCRPCP